MAHRHAHDGSRGHEPRQKSDLFDWVADFDDPVVTAATAPPPAPRFRVLPLALGGGLLVVGATLIAAVVRPFDMGNGLLPTTPRVYEAPSPSPSATEEAPPPPSVLPDDCSGLYGQAMIREFERESMFINMAWTGAREAPAGSSDPELIAMLTGRPSLRCYWLDPTGGTQDAVLTVASEVTPEESAAIAARLIALGFGQQNDMGGVRYFVEARVDGEVKGESHFLRDGVWLATNWYGFGPWGYTRHMAENVFER